MTRRVPRATVPDDPTERHDRVSGSPVLLRCESVNGPPERALAEVRFLTVAEVAAIMRVSKMTVYRLVHSGELPAVRVGGRSFRVPESAVHDYLRDAFVEAG